jgi:hypothetical protein
MTRIQGYQCEFVEQITATRVWFEENILHVQLSDRRIVTLPLEHISWLRWLLEATPEQRAAWSLEPGGYGGYAVYWENLDDGIEVAHLLTVHPLT